MRPSAHPLEYRRSIGVPQRVYPRRNTRGLHLNATHNLGARLNREINHIIVGHISATEIRTCRLDDDRRLSQVLAARNDDAKELLSRSEILTPKPIGRDRTAINTGHR